MAAWRGSRCGWALPLLAVVPPLSAQGVTGAAIAGRVTASDSSPVAEAVVLVTHQPTGQRWQVTSRSSGRFDLENLVVGGPYAVEVQAIGFTPAVLDSLFLSLGERAFLRVTLAPAAALLSPLTVVAEPDPLVNAARTGPAQIIQRSTATRLPVPARDFSLLALLSPQVVRSPSGGLSIAGQPDRLNALQIDGATNNDLLGSSVLGGIGTPGQSLGARTLSIEALKELQVVSAPFDVRFGNFAAGLVNAVTRSGSNRLEGSVSGFFADEHLVGKDPEGNPSNEFSSGEAGLTVGGPIARDRAWFFLDAGLQRGSFTGLFGQGTRAIGTDTTGGADSAGVGIRYESAVRFQQILRDRYGVDAGSFGPEPLRVPAENLFGKLTLALGVNHRLEISHNYSHSVPSTLSFGSRARGAPYGLSSTVFQAPVTTHATRITWTGAIGGRVANELTLARLRERDTCVPSSTFPTVYVAADEGALGAGTTPGCADAFTQQQILELTDNLTLNAGSHRFTFGAHAERVSLSSTPGVAFFFGSQWGFASLDSLDRGSPIRYAATLPAPGRTGPLADFRVIGLGWYAQDQWTPGGRLTLTGGLRVDVPFVAGRPMPNPVLREVLGIDNTVTPSGLPLWQPRLGFSYDLAGDGATYLRGGIGLFAGRPPYKWFNDAYVHTGQDALQLDCSGPDVPSFTLDPARQPTRCGGGTSPVPSFASYFDSHFRLPRNLKVSLGADHRLPWGIVGTVDFLYTQGIDQFYLTDVNLESPTTAAAGEDGRPLYGTIDPATGLATPQRRSSLLGPIIELRNARGDRATSLAGQLKKRFANGTELGLAYTYTHASDRFSAADDVGDADLGHVPLDGTLDDRALATSLWNVPHKITAVATANLPLGFKGSLFYIGMSGSPYTYVVGGDANADGFGDPFGDRLNDIVYVPSSAADVSLVNPAGYPTLDSLIRAERCLQSARGHRAARNSCRNAWTNLANARIGTQVPLGGGRSLEVTADIFNLLHLLDRDWGLVRATGGGGAAVPMLRLVGWDAANGRGIYDLIRVARNAADPDASRWRLQLGARYAF